MRKIEKAYAISNAKINFVSLVDKAANKKRFLIAKAEDADGLAAFQSFGRILKADQESHFVTGIVYEPMTEDTDGNYMTAEEIEKAAHWFMKHGGDVDIQHCFEKAEGVDVVESFVAKSDMEVEGHEISKGTWIMTMEVSDDSVWESIAKGEITGFSMGGVGSFSQEDVDIRRVEKGSGTKGLFRKLAKSLGMDVVEKGEVKDNYSQRVKNDNFWTAQSALESVLRREVYIPGVGYRYVYTEDEDKIREALTDFSEIIADLLSSDDLSGELEKAAKRAGNVEKAGKSLSSKNLAALQEIADKLSDFLSGFVDPDSERTDGDMQDSGNGKSGNNKIQKEDAEMTQKEVREIVEDAVAKAMKPMTAQLEQISKEDAVEEGGTGTVPGKKAKKKEEDPEGISKMVSEAVTKAMEPLQKQVDAIKKSRMMPNNLNDEPDSDLEKSGQHYLHGIL